MEQPNLLIQFIRDGGLVIQAQAPWWSRACASLWPRSRWRRTDDNSVHITVAEVEGAEVGQFIGLVNAEVEVCRFTGDRRYGHAEILSTPALAAGHDHFPLVERAPLLEARSLPS